MRSQPLFKIFCTLCSTLVMLALLSGCSGLPAFEQSSNSGSGAQLWIEFPLDGQTLSNEATTFVVYGTAAEGASGISLKINGETLPAVAAYDLSSDGSRNMIRLEQAWIPPGEGEYTLEAAGVSGGSSSTRFCVVTCQPGTVAVAPTSEVVSTPTDIQITPTLPTVTPDTPTQVTVEFFANPSEVDAGSCSTMHWDVSGTETVYLDGTPVYVRGSQQSCPCESETHTLQVVKADGSTEDYYATISAYGSCYEAPPAESTTAPPPADTSGPTIKSVGTFWEGCSIYGEAYITDPSSVIWAEFWFNHNGQGWSWILMNQTGDQWVSQVGIETGGLEGSFEYKIRTLDSLYNESWSGVSTKNYGYCGD
jgi:hypothetical protein